MLELERTYLAKQLPEDLAELRSVEVEDVYIPDTVPHPSLRIRRKNDSYTLTKKTRIDESDASKQEELNIELTREEYEGLVPQTNRRVQKVRHYSDYNGLTAEIDVFKGALEGLVLIDFEFEDEATQAAFVMPDFCLVDVTQEEFIAGGMLAGKSYEDIEDELERFQYKRF